MSTTLGYSSNYADTSCAFLASDGKLAASVALLGNYLAGSFAAPSEGHGMMLATDSQLIASQHALLTMPTHT